MHKILNLAALWQLISVCFIMGVHIVRFSADFLKLPQNFKQSLEIVTGSPKVLQRRAIQKINWQKLKWEYLFAITWNFFFWGKRVAHFDNECTENLRNITDCKFYLQSIGHLLPFWAFGNFFRKKKIVFSCFLFF